MTFPIQRILRDTRILLGRNACDRSLILACDTDTLHLDQLIISKIERAAREVASEAQTVDLAPGVPLRTALEWPEGVGRGMAIMPLPDDFLRLLRVRLSDWRRPARIIGDNEPMARWQASRFHGIRGNPERPVAVITMQPTGRVAELYASYAGSQVRIHEAIYMPVPRIREHALDFPERLYEQLVERIAVLTANTFQQPLLSPFQDL